MYAAISTRKTKVSRFSPRFGDKKLRTGNTAKHVIFREREREHQRQELWSKVETLAYSKSELELNRSLSVDFNSMTSSPDPDSEGGMDNVVDHDSPDVRSNAKSSLYNANVRRCVC